MSLHTTEVQMISQTHNLCLALIEAETALDEAEKAQQKLRQLVAGDDSYSGAPVQTGCTEALRRSTELKHRVGELAEFLAMMTVKSDQQPIADHCR